MAVMRVSNPRARSGGRKRSKRRRTSAQIAATKRLVAFNKRKRSSGKRGGAVKRKRARKRNPARGSVFTHGQYQRAKKRRSAGAAKRSVRKPTAARSTCRTAAKKLGRCSARARGFRKTNPAEQIEAGGTMKRRSRSRRRHSRRSNPMSPTTKGIIATVGGAVAGAGAGYALDTYEIGSPTVRAVALMGIGVVGGTLLASRNPAMGAAIGTGVATAGAARLIPILMPAHTPSNGSQTTNAQFARAKSVRALKPAMPMRTVKKQVRGLGEVYEDVVSSVEAMDDDVEGVDDSYDDTGVAGVAGVGDVNYQNLSF